MKESKRIFVAAWEYPPIMSGESVVCRKTLEHSHFNYDVCCGTVEAQGNNHVRLFPTGGNKYLQWPFRVAQQFKALDRQEHYAVMMSRVMPPNGHLAGWLIKRAKPSIKWVAYFSDPIWNSPFLKLSLWRDGSHRPNWLLMKVFGFPAKWAVREADLLLFNNLRLAKYVLGKKYKIYKDKVCIAPYGHEGVKPRPVPERRDGKIRLTHVGQIYGNRTLEALVGGVELLQKEAPELFKQLDFRQVGFVCEEERRRVAQSTAAPAFTLVGQVSYEESVEEMYVADCLLVIDPVFDDSKKNIYIPGKIYDYISTARPIICIATEDSATGDVVQEAHGVLAHPDGYSVYQALCACIEGQVEVSYKSDLFSCATGVERLDTALHILKAKEIGKHV